MADVAAARIEAIGAETGLTIRALNVRAVDAPLEDPVVTASGTVASAPLVLVDLVTEEGITGRTYVFTYTPAALAPTARLIQNLETMIKGDTVAPLEIDRKLQQRFRLLGAEGLTGMAMAAVDMAAWDALARARGVPLATLLGGECKPVPSYYSAGMLDERDAARLTEKALGMGFRAFKVKLGHPSVETDRGVIRAIRALVDDGFALMVDFNQSLSAPEAESRIRALEPEGLAWIEEPLLHHDFAGHAALRRKVATPIQIGENWWGVPEYGQEPRGRGIGLRHARRDEDRRRHGMAQGRGAGGSPRSTDIVPHLRRSQRPPPGGHADGALARIPRAGQARPAAAARDPRRQGDSQRDSG